MRNLIDNMRDMGLAVDTVVANNQCQRVGTTDKPRGKDGWYYSVELNGKLFANYGNWATGERGKYHNGDSEATLTADERAALSLLAEKSKREQQERYLFSGIMAEHEYLEARETNAHPYLKSKKLSGLTVKVDSNGAILIPLYDEHGVFNTLQRIYPNGTKKLFYGGRKQNCCHVIQGNNKSVFICEGWATGQSIHKITGNKVLVAIDSGNLSKIATIALKMMPDAQLFIASDNDHEKENNVGLQAGKKAAETISATHIYPPDTIKGTDFNDFVNESGVEVVKEYFLNNCGETQRLTVQDIEASNMSLNLPDEIIYPGGSFNFGIDGLMKHGGPGILQYAYPMITAMLANAIAGKITCQGVWPNVYNVKVGPTSSGKTYSDKELKQGIKRTGLQNFFGMTDISSGAGLYRGLAANPHTMLVIDEITALFRRYGKSDPISDGKRDALLDIFSASGQEIRKVYSNSKNEIYIDSPCLTLTGNSTPLIFDNITDDDFRSGLMQRFDFFCYDGDMPYRGIKSETNNDLDRFCQHIKQLTEIRNPNNTQNLTDVLNIPTDIGLETDCLKMLTDYSKHITDKCNSFNNSNSGLIGITSRRYDLAIKYGLQHIAGTRKPIDIFKPMQVVDLEYGIAVAKILADWKSNILTSKVISGEFHKDCELFKSAIKATIKAGRRPTFALLASRRKQLKNWKQKQSQEIIDILRKRGEIIVDESKSKTAYFLPKTSK